MIKAKLIILALFFCTMLHSLDFRDYNWGDSKEEVLKTEQREPLLNQKEFLVYEGVVAKFPATIIYTFLEDELVRGMYVLQTEYEKNNDYIMDFFYLQKLLTQLYGKPMEELDITKSMVEKDRRGRYGKEIAQGERILQNKWKLERTLIILTLDGKENKLSTRVNYSSFFLLEHLQKKQREDLLRGL